MVRYLSIRLSTLILVLFSAVIAKATTGISYHGRLMNSSGHPVRTATQFKIQIRTPNSENCLMYEETVSRDLSLSDGVFSIVIGDGSGSRTDTLGWSLDKIFSNRAPFSFTGDCAIVTDYNPSPADGRRLQVSFNDGSFSGWEDFPEQMIGYSPLALEAVQVGGFKASHLLRVADPLGNPQNVAPLSPAYFAELVKLADGTSTTYIKDATDLNVVGKVTAAEYCLGSNCITTWPTGGGGGGGAGTVVSVSSSNSYLSVTNGSTTPALTVNVGTAANTVAAGNDSRFTNARTPTGTATGDLSGTYPNPSVAKLQGNAVDSTTLAAGDSGKLLRWSGSSFAAGYISFSDLKTSSGVSQLPASCNVNQKLQWSVLTDAFTCENIALNASAITAGTIDAARLPAGASFWQAGTGGAINYAGGNVGIGTTTPTTPLEVNGNIKAPGFCIGSSCISAWPAAGSNGTVTTVSSTNAYLTVTNPSTTPAFTLNVGTAANTVAAGDDARFTDARAPTGNAAGDLSGTYPNPTVAKIRGNAVTAATLAAGDAGKVYRWSGSSLTAAFINFSDLKNSTGTQQMPAACGTHQKLQWSVLTDAFTCETISGLNASVITAGTIDSARLPASANLWQAGASNSINYLAGNVGIGTATPGSYKLSVLAADAIPGTVARVENSLPITANQAGNFHGAWNTLTPGSSYDFTGTLYAAVNRVNAGSGQSGAISGATGTQTDVYNGGAGTMSAATGISSSIANSSTGTITNAVGISTSVVNSGGGTISNAYGLKINAIAGTNKWSLYSSDAAAPSYFAGWVGIGTSAPETQLHIMSPGDIRITDKTSSATWQREGRIFGQGAEFKAAGALAPSISYYRSQGTLDAPTAVANGDVVGRASYLAYYQSSALSGYSMLETVVDEANGWTMGSGLKVPLTLRWTGLDSAGVRKTHLLIGANGNVGVGTATPGQTLSVVGKGSTVPTAGWVTSTGTPLMGVFGDSSTSGSMDMLVGGATNAPGTRPVVIGRKSRGLLNAPTALSSGDLMFSLMGSGYDGTTFQNFASIDFLVSGAVSSGTVPTAIQFKTGSTTRDEKMRISHEGFVGIGTIAPALNLDVRVPVADGTEGFVAQFLGTGSDTMGRGLMIGVPGKNGVYTYLDKNTSSDFQIRSQTSPQLTILHASGNVGIGTVTPNQKLHVYNAGTGVVASFQNTTGTCTVTPNTSSLACSSDIRLKKNIESILGLDALNKVLNLQAKTYEWKESDGKRHIGYIAQEAEQVVPELVTEDSQGFKQVSYSAFVPLLSEAIKELHHESKRDIASLENEVQTLKEKNKALEERLKRIEALLSKK